MLNVIRDLAAIRKRVGYSQNDVAQMLGMGQPNIARMEKPDNWKSLTLGNIHNWLAICGLSNHTDAIYLDKISRIKTDPNLYFFRALEQLMVTRGVMGSLYTKPLCAIVCSDASDRLLQTEVCRLLAINCGDRLFLGFYQPAPSITVLLKHVSERPLWLDNHVYILDGVMSPNMRCSPNIFLDTLIDEKWEVKREGGFSILNDAPAGSIAVVYTDHPLLKHIDVLQPSENFDNLQDYSNFEMCTSADITILCNESNVGASPSDALRSISAGKPPDILASREGRSLNLLLSDFNELYNNVISTMLVREHTKLIHPEKKTIDKLLELVLLLCNRATNETNIFLKDPKYSATQNGYITERSLPVRRSDVYLMVAPILENMQLQSFKYPLDFYHLKYFYKAIKKLRTTNISRLEPTLRASSMNNISKYLQTDSISCESDIPAAEFRGYSYTPDHRMFLTDLVQNIIPSMNG